MGFQLFWAAFDLLVTVVPIKVAFRLGKLDFCAIQKNNHEQSLDIHLCDYFFKCPNINFSHPKTTFNGTTHTSYGLRNPKSKFNKNLQSELVKNEL